MRKITAGLFISLDGVVEAPEKWHFPYLNEEMGAAVGSMQAQADTLLLGRVTYEGFAAVWPHQTGELADRLNNVRKLVVSSTLEKAEWNNSTVIGTDLVDEVTRLKQQPGKDISITGSITVTRTLLGAGLVDELHLLVHPIILGAGLRLFEDGTKQQKLALVDSATFSTGVVHLTYQPA